MKLPVNQWFNSFRGRRLTTDQEQALIRFMIVMIMVTAFYFWLPQAAWRAGSWIVFVGIGYCVFMIGLTLFDDHYLAVRRHGSQVLDAGFLGCAHYAFGIYGSLIVAAWLWNTLGHGFRFGNRSLFVSQVSALSAYTVVVLLNSDVRSATPWVVTSYACLVMIPFYGSILISRLVQARERAEEETRAKVRFLANVSHEMRSPIAATLGLCELLESGGLTRTQQQQILVIKNSAKTELRLVHDLLDASRLGSNQLVLVNRPVVLADEIAALTNAFRPQADLKRLDFSVECSIPCEAVLLDRVRFGQVAANLLGNAIKFTETGHIKLVATAERGSAKHFTLALTVEDTGVGIPADKHEMVFKEFAQADDTIAKRYGGTGLGMAIAKQIVELMGGEIGFTSSAGRGSRFWVRLPLQTAPSDAVVAAKDDDPSDLVPPIETYEAAQSSTDDGAAPVPSMVILVCEDSQTAADYLRLALEHFGHRLVLTRTVEEAMATLSQHTFDMAIVDVHIGEDSGIDLIRRARSQLGASLPFVVMTADTSSSTEAEARAAGAASVLLKPVSPGRLKQEIRRIAEDRECYTLLVDEAVLRRVRNVAPDHDVAVRLVNNFVQETGHFFCECPWRQGSRTNLRERLHGLKGDAGVVGAIVLERRLGDMLAEPQLPDNEKLEERMAEMKALFEKTAILLKASTRDPVTPLRGQHGR